jgi:uncharacterized protein
MAEIASLYRHPVKGLTPEPLSEARLEVGRYFPNDRRWAVEAGPSGFDPAKPGHISKQKFTVLARFPSLARLKTRYEDESHTLHIGDQAGFGIETRLDTEEGRASLARFLQVYLSGEATGEFRVFDGEEAPAEKGPTEGRMGHRFTDHPQGYVSLINLASVRALGWAIGADVDPLRFRANIYVDGLPPWAEDGWAVGSKLAAGEAELMLFKPIVRCVATHVNLETGERDIDTVGLLRQHFGRDTFGTYFSVTRGGRLAPGAKIGVPA